MSASHALAKKVLLVGWDAADWQLINPLIDAGKMPNLCRLIEKGMMGNILSLQPMLSPILWTSIATGKRAYQHGIHGFVEPTQDGTALRPASSSSRRAKALWNILSQSGLRCHVVGWFASHPAETINGVCVSNQFAVAPSLRQPENWPVAPGSVAPWAEAEKIADLRVHPSEIPGDFLLPFIPDAARLDQTRPAIAHLLTFLAKRLAECLTVHAVATDLMERHPWDFCAVYYEAIDQIGHEFMVYHPPKMEHLPEEIFQAFQYVMDGVYQFHDQMLGRLIELAGGEAHVLVLSDHGFLNGNRRPREVVEAASWHRAFGMFAARGPGLKQDTLIHGATLLDIAPTVLTLFGLPVGQDMEGSVLVNGFEAMPEIRRIESWELVRDEHALPATEEATDDPEVASEVMRQLIELGYLESPGEDVLRDIARAKAEQRFNLAASYMCGRRFKEALTLTTQLMEDFPQELRHAVLHGQAAIPAANVEALQTAIAAVQRIAPDNRQIELFQGFLAFLNNDAKTALRHFKAASFRTPDDPWVHCRVGRACLRLRRWEEAEAAFQRSEELDADNPEAAYGLSVAVARLGRPEEAVEHGLRAIQQLHDFPLAHFQLGAVLSKLELYERAIQAFEICIAMRPNFALAHRYLSRIYAQLGRVLESQKARDTAARILASDLPQPQTD
jgi:tetratricopeptide (TPR) repeat protein/arylsulfatase A-like enzyme